ncbi:hypothetical protein JQC67_02705 [Aurantibacter crassamenti]|uniref:hypothetical protein n=1 Tax=Aurantibacter crassamenti TaxID=1837375 RepID=UPI001939AA1E|nr:hypothetical protein [Aurantibacter crassamenti]MBM1105041.1 hypothetical protein [Aurantibacter crassamenti]
MRQYRLLVHLLILILLSCGGNPKEEKATVEGKPVEVKKEPVNLNVSLLLDLSDRVDTVKYHNETMEFYLRDVGYIESISNAFINHLSLKKKRIIDDKIALFFNPEPKNQRINRISEDLKFHINRGNATTELFDNVKSVYSNKPKEIYEQTLEDNKYVGSDVWSFFKNKVKDFCIEEKSRNILIILTDGYLFHIDNIRDQENLSTYLTPQSIKKNQLNQADWEQKFNDKNYGFIPATTELNDLEVLVLGINPAKGNVYEDDIIKAYWENWFDKMEVGHYELRNADLPSDMDKIIREFILKD